MDQDDMSRKTLTWPMVMISERCHLARASMASMTVRNMTAGHTRQATRLIHSEQVFCEIGGYDIGMIFVIVWYPLERVVLKFSD